MENLITTQHPNNSLKGILLRFGIHTPRNRGSISSDHFKKETLYSGSPFSWRRKTGLEMENLITTQHPYNLLKRILLKSGLQSTKKLGILEVCQC